LQKNDEGCAESNEYEIRGTETKNEWKVHFTVDEGKIGLLENGEYEFMS